MPITATPTYNPPLPPQALLTVENELAGMLVTIERTLDGRAWEKVRGAIDIPMPQGAAVIVPDWAVPLNTPVWYRLLLNGHVWGQTSVTVNTTNGASWIQDAFSPQNGLPVRIDTLTPGAGVYDMDAFRSARWPQPSDEVQVLGASLPIESVGPRSQVGNIPIIIHTLTETDSTRLRNLLFDSGILLVRGTECDLLPPAAFIALPDVRELHLGNPHEVATFTGNARLTREPSALLTIPAWTWNQVQEHVESRLGSGATWAQVKARTPESTWDEILADPTRLASQT